MEVRDEVSSLHDQWWSSLKNIVQIVYCIVGIPASRAHIYSFFRDLEAWLKSYDVICTYLSSNPILDLNVSVEINFRDGLFVYLFKFIAKLSSGSLCHTRSCPFVDSPIEPLHFLSHMVRDVSAL